MARVLVVGDVPSFRRILSATLRSRGIDVDEADIGRDSLSRLKEAPPDAIVLHLPGGVLAGAYLEQLSQAAPECRIFVVAEPDHESRPRTTVTATFVSRTDVSGLVESVSMFTVTRTMQ